MPATRDRSKRYGLRSCEVCAVEYYPNYQAQRTCGRTCGLVISTAPRRTDLGCIVPWNRCITCSQSFINLRKKQYCSKKCNNAANCVPQISCLILTCIVCSQTFPYTTKQGRSPGCCSTVCRVLMQKQHAAAYRAKRRARQKGAVQEVVRPLAVFDRDDWICHICNESCSRTKQQDYDPWKPSLDHVIPLSRGGDHTYANIKTAHVWCNSVKCDNPDFTWAA